VLHCIWSLTASCPCSGGAEKAGGREGGKKEEERVAPLLKSRDPHLAGGTIPLMNMHENRWDLWTFPPKNNVETIAIAEILGVPYPNFFGPLPPWHPRRATWQPRTPSPHPA